VSSNGSPAPASSPLDSEAKWRSAYEKVVRENEQLRNRGGDVMLANQWRERYDGLVRERDDLLEKLRVYTHAHSRLDGSGSGSGGGAGGGKSIEQAFLDLKDEYKVGRPPASRALCRHSHNTNLTPPPSSSPLFSSFQFRRSTVGA
jgi:hypothetical protein